MDGANDVSARSRSSNPALSNLGQRILSALVLLPLLGLTVWLGGVLLYAVATGAALLALHELYQLFAHTGYRPRPIGYVCSALLIGAAVVQTTVPQRVVDPSGFAVAITIIATLAAELPRRERTGALLSWALTMSGALYTGWTIAHFVLLRAVAHPLAPAPLSFLQLDAGLAWLLLALMVTLTTDSAAYFVGRALGRHRMAPYISPRKSWEGAIGGLICAIIMGATLSWLLGLPVGWATGALLGAIGSVAGQAGDLVESLIKRQVGVKDSGRLIPGHGGLLDRADSLLFTVPIVYYMARWLTL